MAEKTNKPKPEDERPVEYSAGKEPDAPAPGSSGRGGTAVQPAYSYPAPTPGEEPCPGGLRVTASERENGVDRPLAGVTVEVESAPGTQPFSGSTVTDASGVVNWRLPEGSYNVRLTAPHGLTAVSVSPSPVVVHPFLTFDFRAVYEEEPSEVFVHLFHDADGSGVPGNQPRVSGRVDFLDKDGRLIACEVAGDDGVVSHTFRDIDSVEIRLQPSYRLGAQILQHRFQTGLYANLGPGTCVTYSVPLYSARAEVLLAAALVDGGKSAPLIGARFLIHRGTDVSRAPADAEVFTGQTLRWTNLDTDYYTITALPPDSAAGRRMKATHPRDGSMHIQLLPGVNDLRSLFLFESCVERVTVRVVKDACGSPLAGVYMEFVNETDGTIVTVPTSTDGIAALDAAPAVYLIRTATPVFVAEGAEWTIDQATPVRVDMRNPRPGSGNVTMLAVKEEHSVRCIVQDFRGNPRAFAAIEIYDESGAKVKDANTNAQGELREKLPTAGHYTMVILPQVQRVAFETHSEVDLGIIRTGGDSARGFGGGGDGGGRAAESLADLTSYPLLTESSGGGGSAGRQRRPSGVSSASTSQFGFTVEGAIREVLGWRPKAGDMKGFAEALTRSFDVKEIEGRTEVTWTPRAAALVVESELGAITGAQKSIYERGKAALDQAVPKLEAIYPLRNDADPENCDAVRYIVRTAFEDLVREFGQSGGPRVQLVNDKFNLLVGNSNLAVTEQLDPTCQLAVMRDRFGLRRGNVNTIAEEENLTNFLVVIDHIKSLRITWNNNIQFFDRSGADPFLGTQLVLLSRALGNVAEGVDEVRYVLSTVLLDEAEQQTILIEYTGQTPLYVSELLNWVEHVATVEGPRLLTESGKDGAAALHGTLELLQTLVAGAQNPPNTVPSAYRTTRVQRALQELSLALQDAARLSDIEGVN